MPRSTRCVDRTRGALLGLSGFGCVLICAGVARAGTLAPPVCPVYTRAPCPLRRCRRAPSEGDLAWSCLGFAAGTSPSSAGPVNEPPHSPSIADLVENRWVGQRPIDLTVNVQSDLDSGGGGGAAAVTTAAATSRPSPNP